MNNHAEYATFLITITGRADLSVVAGEGRGGGEGRGEVGSEDGETPTFHQTTTDIVNTKKSMVRVRRRQL